MYFTLDLIWLLMEMLQDNFPKREILRVDER